MSATKERVMRDDKQRGREIRIAVVDVKGQNLPGAKIQVYLEKSPIAELVLGQRPGSIHLNDLDSPITLMATHEGEVQTVTLGADVRVQAFVFKTVYRENFAVDPAQARCPDGTTGIPCVECAIGGTRVRVCV